MKESTKNYLNELEAYEIMIKVLKQLDAHYMRVEKSSCYGSKSLFNRLHSSIRNLAEKPSSKDVMQSFRQVKQDFISYVNDFITKYHTSDYNIAGLESIIQDVEKVSNAGVAKVEQPTHSEIIAQEMQTMKDNMKKLTDSLTKSSNKQGTASFNMQQALIMIGITIAATAIVLGIGIAIGKKINNKQVEKATSFAAKVIENRLNSGRAL